MYVYHLFLIIGVQNSSHSLDTFVFALFFLFGIHIIVWDVVFHFRSSARDDVVALMMRHVLHVPAQIERAESDQTHNKYIAHLSD